jgi:hypothetical protein
VLVDPEDEHAIEQGLRAAAQLPTPNPVRPEARRAHRSAAEREHDEKTAHQGQHQAAQGHRHFVSVESNNR